MNRRSIRRLAVGFGTFTLLAGSTTQALATDLVKTDTTSTPAAYADYLRHSNEDGAAQASKAFDALSPNEQKQFVTHLHDPALFASFLNQPVKQEEGITASTYNSSHTTTVKGGDVTFVSRRDITAATSTAKPLPKGNHWASYTQDLKIKGITVLKLKLSVNFHSNGKDVTKVNYAEASKKNLSGLIKVAHDSPKTWLGQWKLCKKGKPCSHGHLAGASVVWEGTVSGPSYEFQVDKKQTMEANVYGSVTYKTFKNA
ncbi:hypothetical protein ACF09J_04160 [Streptomyces sp. NPDC014889]|uniref:hypothetical protein n=1 Tax=Streptomyces sp. NPDC014889 TaxID=3364928 RepID=UPI0036FAE7EB